MNKEFVRELGIDNLSIEIKKGNIETFIFLTIDTYKINYVNIDQYNNLYCEVPQQIPINYISKIRRFFNEYIEHQDSWYHRSGTGFLIHYFENQCRSLTKEDIQALCDLDDEDCENPTSNFRGWLVGTAFTSYGNLKKFRPELSYDLFKNRKDE
jgi:hypothetical protein